MIKKKLQIEQWHKIWLIQQDYGYIISHSNLVGLKNLEIKGCLHQGIKLGNLESCTVLMELSDWKSQKISILDFYKMDLLSK